jgi:regulator of sigma E protease
MSTNIFAFIIVLGILIFVHEFGHFIVARLFGVGVEKFSLGFGPRLFGKTIGITDYRISAIPLGGFVKMVGDEPDEVLPDSQIPLSFTHKHVLKRILIVAAGPFFNLFLAVVIFFGFYLILGIENVTPVVRYVEAHSPAQVSGLKIGDVITSINGEGVDSWYDINNAIEKSDGRTLSMGMDRSGSFFTADLVPIVKVGEDIFGDESEYYDIGIAGLPELEAVVGGVSEAFPAQKAGLQKGDRIEAIDGVAVENWNAMREMISASRGNPLTISVRRQDHLLTVTLTPMLKEGKDALGEKIERYLIGISTAAPDIPDQEKMVVRLNPLTAFGESLQRTWLVIELSVKGIVKMIQGSISRDNLGGPIMIAQMAGDQAREGVDKLIQFVAFISINLAILNFMPIPVLDGGHLLFFFIEAVIRRPVGIRIREMAQQAGMIALLMLMVFVFYNDIMRYFIKS